MEWKPSTIDDNWAFPTLEELSLVKCELLQGYFPCYLPSLQILEIEDCYNLKVLLPSCTLIRKLMISGCKELCSTGVVICCSESIRLVHIRKFTGIKGFWVQGLQQLVVGGYETFEGFWAPGLRQQSRKLIEIIGCPKLHTWPLDGYGALDGKLTNVRLVNCEGLIPFLQGNNLLSTVRHLFINSFYSLRKAATLTGQCTCLEVLSVGQCSSLLTIDQLPVALRRLNIYKCRKLQSVEFDDSWSTNNGGKFFLEEVNIERCKSLTSLFSRSFFDTTQQAESSSSSILAFMQKGPCELSKLTRLRVSECPFGTLFLQGLLLPRIKELSLTYCTNAEVIPSQVSNFTTLTRLDFVDVKITQPAREWGLDLLTSLQILELAPLGSSADSVECISGPDLYLPPSLSHLLIRGFKILKSLFCYSLPNLTELSVHSCPRFESFVDSYLPPKLRDVKIFDCPLMDEQCIRDPGGPIRTEFDDEDDDVYSGGYLSPDSDTSN